MKISTIFKLIFNVETISYRTEITDTVENERENALTKYRSNELQFLITQTTRPGTTTTMTRGRQTGMIPQQSSSAESAQFRRVLVRKFGVSKIAVKGGQGHDLLWAPSQSALTFHSKILFKITKRYTQLTC